MANDYLLGVANGPLKILRTIGSAHEVSAPRFALPAKVMVGWLDSWLTRIPAMEPRFAGETGRSRWRSISGTNCAKASREIGFRPRDPGETLHDTVSYLRENFLAGMRLAGRAVARPSEGSDPPPKPP